MREVEKVDAISTIASLEAIEARPPTKRLIHLVLDNTRCHCANLVKAWLARR